MEALAHLRRARKALLVPVIGICSAGLLLDLPELTAAPTQAGQEDAQESGQEENPRVDLRPQAGPGSVLQESEYFRTADYDSNEWISFEEARQALSIDRSEYWRYDTNSDARVTADEFSARYLDIVGRVGSFPAPQSSEVPLIAPPRDADQLRNAYDRDLNGGLGPGEFQTLLKEYGLEEFDAAKMYKTLDVNGDFLLGLAELEAVSKQLENFRSTVTPGLLESFSSVEELFGVLVPRPPGPGEIASPPKIAGPVPPFARLDLNRDGQLTASDFDELAFPLTLPVRSVTVIASLDTDGDKALSEAELRLAME